MLNGKRIAILAEQDFEDVELTEPLRAMKAAGARAMVVGSGSQKSYKGKPTTSMPLSSLAGMRRTRCGCTSP
jgi:putative intracellular protease/amidase